MRMNRATIAFVGAAVLIILNAISMEQAYEAIDLNTIVLLLSIMILNANFRLSGFFYIVTQFILKIAKTPKQLLALLILFSGLLSALFLNDTIVLVFTPLVLAITGNLKQNPIPYLMALATSANIGSVATIIGNPQNIIIGTLSGISFLDFSAHLIPVAIAGLCLNWAIIVLVYRKDFSKANFKVVTLPKLRVHRPLMLKSIIATILMLTALIIGVPVTIAAMGAASLVLITRRLKAERVFSEIDWALLVFFAALFIVTKAIESIGVGQQVVGYLKMNSGNEIVNFSILSTISSNLISNVPAVLLLKNVALSFSNTKIAWLVMAMATTFAGNLTLLGSVANLIVAETAHKHGVKLSFTEYLKTGILITILTMSVGILWLHFFW